MQLDDSALQSAFAELVGASQPAIHKHVDSGLLKKGDSYREWLSTYCEHLRLVASGRALSEAREQAEISKARESLANAKLKELQLHREYKDVVSVAQVESAMRDWATLAQQEFTNAIEKIIEMIESEHDITVDRENIDDIHHAASRAIGDFSVQSTGGN